MNFTTIFFILLSIVVIGYVINSIYSQRRAHLLQEVFFLFIYIGALIIFLFPNLLNVIEDMLGIQSAINFLMYLAIFILFFINFLLYRKTEDQRVEVTKLVREIAHLKKHDAVSKRKSTKK